ncbi:MAG: tyrosine-type recombinase/integrase [Candidatus Omnitrophica bacterium]|nr:tyrosine-type recombinase/integrase [Candidatus Omnitrophota bacterium]
MKDELFRKKPKNNHFSWSVDETKYLDLEKVRKLRKVCQQAKDKALKGNKVVPVRDWFMVELGLFTGLRVEEMVNLKVSDLHLKEEQSSLTVKKGKGDKSRTVYLPEAFKKECLFYSNWKEKAIPQSDYLFTNTKGQQLTKRALQKAFKRCLELAGLESRYSIHCLRHTYGSFLYKSSNHNLRLVQEQLGHSSIRTTQVYASLMNEEVKKAVDKIYQ